MIFADFLLTASKSGKIDLYPLDYLFLAVQVDSKSDIGV